MCLFLVVIRNNVENVGNVKHLDKPEQEQHHTNAIGFTIPNEDEE